MEFERSNGDGDTTITKDLMNNGDLLVFEDLAEEAKKSESEGEEEGTRMKDLFNGDTCLNLETSVPTNGVTDHVSAQCSQDSENSCKLDKESEAINQSSLINSSDFNNLGASGEAQSDSGHLFSVNSISDLMTGHGFSSATQSGSTTTNGLEEKLADCGGDLPDRSMAKGGEVENDSSFESDAAERMELHKCSICCNRLEDARVLTCLHRFCYKCINEKAYSGPVPDTFKMSNSNKQIQCPECSQITPLAYLVRDLVSVNSEDCSLDRSGASNADSTLGICTACKSGEKAVGKCYTCETHLCQSCVSAHRTMRCFEAHSLVEYPSNGLNQGPKCTKHVDEPLEYYCATCQEFCCRVCLHNSHVKTNEMNGAVSPHTYYEIDGKLIQKSVEHLKRMIEESREKLAPCEELITDLNSCLNDLSYNKESARQAIDEQYHSLKALIDKYHQQLLGQLNALHQQRRLQLWDSINHCEKAFEQVEEALSYAQLFANHNPETKRHYFIEALKLKELISYQLRMLINNNIGFIQKKRKALAAEAAMGNDCLTFNPVDLAAVESTLLPSFFGVLLTENCPNQSSAELKIQPELACGNLDRGLNLDLSPEDLLLSPTLSTPGLDSSLVKSLGAITTTATGFQADHSLRSSCPNIPPLAMPIAKPKPNRQTSLGVNTPEPLFSGTQTFSGQSSSLSARTTPEPNLIQQHPIVTNIVTGLNLRSISSTTSAFVSNVHSNGAGNLNSHGALDLSDVITRMNLAQLALYDNADNQQGLTAISKAVSNTPSPQPTLPNTSVPLENSGFILNEAAINNINELAKLTTQQQNGLPPLTGSLPTPTPPSSSGNTPPLAFASLPPRCSAKVNIMQIRCKFGQLGSQRGHFSSPHGFCLGVDEEIVIADTNNHRICIFDKNGEYKNMFGTAGKDEGQLWYPRKVAIIRVNGSSGACVSPRYVICDRGSERSRMQIFTRNGHFIRKIAIRYIDIVAGLAITPSGHIVAVDSVSPTVFVIAESGDLLRWFDCSEHMREPSDLAVNGQEYYICDFKGHCVVVFNEEGQYLRRIGGERVTNFPNGIDISDAGDILVGDSHGNRFHVVVFDRHGTLLSEFECPYVKVSRCCGLKITSEGYVVTLAKNNHHVLILNTLYIM